MSICVFVHLQGGVYHRNSQRWEHIIFSTITNFTFLSNKKFHSCAYWVFTCQLICSKTSSFNMGNNMWCLQIFLSCWCITKIRSNKYLIFIWLVRYICDITYSNCLYNAWHQSSSVIFIVMLSLLFCLVCVSYQ